jgi:VWFA-related protein
MKKTLILGVLFFFFFGLFCPWAWGSNQVQKNQESLQHEVTVTLKLIQVFVTDKDAKPVTGLGKTDFELWDNGELKTITDFETHTLILPQTQAEKIKPYPAPTAPKLNRKFFFVLDFEKNDYVGAIKAKKAALHFIETQLQPTDEAAVFSYSQMQGLVLHRYLTKDHPSLKKTIQGMRGMPGRRPGGGIPVQNPYEDGVPAVLPTTPSIPEVPLESPEIKVERIKTNRFINVIKHLAKYLGYLPGYKNLIFFSQGISRSLIYDQRDLSVLANFLEMSRELGAANSPVYAVNTERAGAHLKNSEARGNDSLKMLSDLSGGKYFDNVDHYQEIAQDLQVSTGNYYVLGYYVEEQWNGQFHEIKVKVGREGCTVAAQGGYFNPEPFLKLSEAEKQLQLIALALSDRPLLQKPPDFPLLALTVSPQLQNNIVFLSELQKDNLEEIVAHKTEITYFVLDDQKNIVDFKGGEVDFSSLGNKVVYHYSVASLNPGTYECRTVLRNLETGRTAMSAAPVIIPSRSPTGLHLFSPLLVLPLEEEEAFYVKVTRTKEKKSDTISLKDIYPYISNTAVPIMEECRAGVSMMLGIVRCLVKDIDQPKIELTARLREQRSLEEVPLTCSLLSSQKTGDLQIMLVQLKFPALKAGDYVLRFAAKEATSGRKSDLSRELKVR